MLRLLLSLALLGACVDPAAGSEDAARPAVDGAAAGEGDSATAPAQDSAADVAAPREGPIRVLFDATKDERAGNADWVIDDAGGLPSPAHPSRESDWAGGISSWAYELHATGRYAVETLPSGGRVTFGDPANAQDLSRYDVFVVPEPNTPFSAAESDALVAFVRSGGGLFVIANHGGSDRNNDGFDPPEVWNAFFDRVGNVLGVRFAGDDITESPDDNVAESASSPVLHGPFGHVAAITYYDGSTMLLDPTANPTVQPLAWRRGAVRGNTGVTLAAATLDAGRMVAIGDSSPADDGTGAGRLEDGWNDERGDNREMFLDATAWLGRDVERR